MTTKEQAAEALAEAVRSVVARLPVAASVDGLTEALAAYDAAPPDDRLEKVREWAENGQRNVSLDPYWTHEDMQPYREVLAILDQTGAKVPSGDNETDG